MNDGSADSRMAVLEERCGKLESVDAKQWEMINDLRDRLPNWAVAVMTMGGGVIGFLLNWGLTCIKR